MSNEIAKMIKVVLCPNCGGCIIQASLKVAEYHMVKNSFKKYEKKGCEIKTVKKDELPEWCKCGKRQDMIKKAETDEITIDEFINEKTLRGEE